MMNSKSAAETRPADSAGASLPALAPSGPVQVLVVGACESSRRFLSDGLQGDARIRLVAAVEGADAALRHLLRGDAQVLLMEHQPPALDGFEATRQIMETHPLPIVVCAATSTGDAVFRSMEAGAVACIETPSSNGAASTAHLRQTLALMAEVRVVRRRHAAAARRVRESRPVGGAMGIVGIGSSTGGPPVLQTIFAALPADFQLPVLVVQHIARGFLPSMAEWLSQTSGLKVQIAAYGMQPMPGHVYLAPDDFQMGLSAERRIVLARPAAPAPGLCPSVSHLFAALAEICPRQTIAVLLTGMGADGARELKLLRDRGAQTMVQDKASSVVHGMPGEAVRLGAAMQVLSPERIAEQLVLLAQQPARVTE